MGVAAPARWLARAWAGIGNASGLAGLYTAACTLMVAQVGYADRDPGVTALAFSLLMGLGVYLLDRVKLSDALLDPADARAQPRRHAFVRRWAPALRVLAWASFLAASVLGWGLRPVLALAPLAGAAVVLAYGGGLAWPRRRLKSRMVVKNLLVATCLSVLGVAAAGAERAEPRHLWRVALGAGVVVLVVFADAVLCDLADAETDRWAGTRTIAAHFGRSTAWAVALGVESVGVAVAAGLGGPALAWTGALLVTTPALMLLPLGLVRDAVDLRLPVLGAALWAAWPMAGWGGV